MNNLPEIYLTEENSNPIGEKFVVFTLGDELFAVSARNVSEVASPLSITALPKAPEWLFGITNLRGEIVSVINLPKLWKREIPATFAKPKLIILRGKNGTLALAADRLNEIVSLADDAIKPTKENSHICAQAILDEKTLNLIDSENLFEDLRFL
jgi:purine-binding chemotaxis protein CheW